MNNKKNFKKGEHGGCILHSHAKIKNETYWNWSKKVGKGRGGWTKERIKPTKIYCKYICKYHTVSPCKTKTLINSCMLNDYLVYSWSKIYIYIYIQWSF
jgi:hypothetical protein